jgi:putative ABC transport system permease protein
MSWFSRVLNVGRGRRLNTQLDDEFRFHIASRAEELMRQGMTADEAQEQAKRLFGNALMLRDSSRDAKMSTRLESIVRDIRFGLRLFRKYPSVTAAAILSLSLTIGACTGAFSLINALILRPLPVDDPQSLVYAVYRSPGDPEDSASFNYPVFERMRAAGGAQIQLFGMSFSTRRDAVFDDAVGQSEKIDAQWISGDAFGILGVRSALGRLLAASDDRTPGQHPVAVISYDFWQRRFGGSAAVLGRWVTVREKALQIIGVAEQGFTGVEPGTMTDLWAPTMMWADDAISNPGWSWFRVWGRLRPDVRIEQAQARLQPVFASFRRDYATRLPADAPSSQIEQYVNTPVRLLSAANGPSGVRKNFGRALWILGAVAALVLLIAAANVASLLLARASTREREFALRIAIGAGRWRLMQQILIESAMLTLVSMALGALMGQVAGRQVVQLLSPSNAMIRLDVSLDWRVLAFLGCVGGVVTLVFGLAPALRGSAVRPYDALKAGGGKYSARLGVFQPFVAAQVVFGFIVLFLGGLLLTSFARLVRADLGFDTNQLIIARVESPELRESGPKALVYWKQLLDRLGETSGVQSVSLSGWALFEGSTSSRSVRFPGRSPEAFEPYYLPVSPGFFKTMRIELLEGRDLEWRDVRSGGDSAVVVNERFARRYFPGESAVGRKFSYVNGNNPPISQEIVGLVRDAKYASVRDAAPPTVYLPQWPSGWAELQLRTPLEPSALATRLRETLPQVHSTLRLADLTMQATLVDNVLVKERLLALLSAFFVVVSLVLVCVGLYGVLNYNVVQRTREIAIRLALGSRRSTVIGLVLSQLALVIGIGAMLGVAGGVASSRLIKAVLYDVEPSDASSLAFPLILLLGICAAASLLPALRAVRIDPTAALRSE